MAQNKKSGGLCERIRNAVSPFRPRIRRVSHQPQSSISVTGDKNPVEISSKPVHVLHQNSLGEAIPIEFGHGRNSGKGSESDEREIAVIRGQKFAKSVARKPEKIAPAEDKPPNHVRIEKARSKKDGDHSVHDGKFLDYITKFKDRMVKTASNINSGDVAVGGGGGGGRVKSARRDSFDDKVMNYIDRAKAKMRTTTNAGVDQKSVSQIK